MQGTILVPDAKFETEEYVACTHQNCLTQTVLQYCNQNATYLHKKIMLRYIEFPLIGEILAIFLKYGSTLAPPQHSYFAYNYT